MANIIFYLRFACRLLCFRDSADSRPRVYAAGFDSSRNIFLGEKATKWETEHQAVDGLTTNGVLLMHPQTSFCGADHPETVTKEPGKLVTSYFNAQKFIPNLNFCYFSLFIVH